MKWILLALSVLAQDDKVDNPEYAGWSAHKTGAWIRFQQTVDAGRDRTISEIRCVLIDVSPTRAVDEVRTRILSGEEARELPLERREIPARTVNAGRVTEGEEQIVVGGRTLKCRWIEDVVGRNKDEVVTKSWYCADVPGALVKREIHATRDPAAVTTLVAELWNPDEARRKR